MEMNSAFEFKITYGHGRRRNEPYLLGLILDMVQEVSNAPVVTLADGLQYQDIRKGGGQAVRQGFLTVLHYR